MQTSATGLCSRLVLGLVAVFLTATIALAEPVAINFRDLPDPAALDFDDPFRDMGFEMLEELRTVVRLEQRLESGEVSDEARPRLEARLNKARATLSLAGHDIEDLLARRWAVADARKRALLATNPDLHQTTISITGFLIPAGKDEDGHGVGYLVPEVSMCSHKPLPPPNQLIRVTFGAGSPAGTLYTPVTVSGMLETEETNEIVFILDGAVRMASMWELDATDVTLATRLGGRSSLDPWQVRVMSYSERAAGHK